MKKNYIFLIYQKYQIKINIKLRNVSSVYKYLSTFDLTHTLRNNK